MLNFSYTLYSSPYIYNLNYVGTSSIADNTYLQYNSLFYNFEDMLKHKFSSSPDTGTTSYSLYPLAVRAHYYNTYVIERPPFQISSIDYSTNRSYRSRKVLKSFQTGTIWVPWTVAVITLDPEQGSNPEFRLYFNDKPLESLEDPLIPCFFPNSSTGSICMGQDALNFTSLNNLDISEVYNHLFNSYFSGWNSDISIIPEGLEYFSDIKDQILSYKDCPKNFGSLFDRYSYRMNSSEVHKNMLYLMSKLSIDQTLGFITHLKKIEPNYSSGIATTYSLDKIIYKNSKNYYRSSLDSSFDSNRYNHTRYLNRYLEHLALSVLPSAKDGVITRYTVAISNVPDYISESILIPNPYIVSEIYKKSLEFYGEKTYNRNIEIDFSTIEPYIQPNHEAINVDAN